MRRQTRTPDPLTSVELTEKGMLWAVANFDVSLSARIAITGEDAGGWPAVVVQRSVKTCNAAAVLELNNSAELEVALGS